MKKTALLAMASTLVITIATPASAAISYCGHGKNWGVTGMSSYWGGWTDNQNRHRHSVRVAQYFTQKTRTDNPVCEKHRR